VWTPKRILLLTGGGFLFVSLYVFYAFFLGGIDGLPPLPEACLPDPTHKPPDTPPPPPPINPTEKKLRLAFGDECEEARRDIKIEMKAKGLVLSCNEFKIEDDGRVRLTPFSIAVFKDKGDGSFPEINTVRCKEAYLRFEQPIVAITDMGSHRIVGAEFRGDIKASNNRRTPLKSDDLEAQIPKGPVFFDDQENIIWTDDFVKLLDTQTQPQPTAIKAKGLELHLTKDTPAAKPAGHGGAKGTVSTTITGVERIILRSNVEMDLWVDVRSGFPGGGPEKPGRPEAAPAAPVEKSKVIIKTVGPFNYDLQKDFAEFESPPPGSNQGEGLAPGQVLVLREHIQGKARLYDQVVCDLLELQFRRKQAPASKGARDAGSSDREIDHARATARPGHEVILTMDGENLDAHGDEMLYYSPTPDKGPQTILRGQHMWAVKDAHKISAPELHLIGADARGEGQRGFAKGPGQIDLLDRNNGAKVHQYHALWKDHLVVTKDREGERVFDLLTFTGDAAFIDDEHHQDMRGDRLQVWLEPPPRQEETAGPTAKKQTTAAGAPRQRPYKVEAVDHVVVRSGELNVRECEHLTVRFKDGPAQQVLPDTLPPSADAEPGLPLAKGTDKARTGPPPPSGRAGTDGPAADAKAPPERKPIHLRARRVDAQVLRAGSKNELQEVFTEGSVHVHQDGTKPEDKGIDIQGEMLNLVRFPQGDVLVVFGDSRGPAQLQLGELFLAGPKVTINQRDNMAEVEGVGAMHLPSNTGLDGSPAKKPGSRLTVHWTKDMLFDGSHADFRGGVVAYQEDASLRCQTMQVTLDKVVSFKEGQKGGQGAKVEKLVCDHKVYVADTTRDDKGELLRYQRLVAVELTADNPLGRTDAIGPGKVFLLQQGTPEANGSIKPAAASQKQELTLTRVDYQGHMSSLLENKTRITTFLDNVEVFHLPANNPDVAISRDQVPKGGLYMKCERLKIASRPLPDGKTGQLMTADKSVTFRTPEFYGRCPVLKYDQPQEIVIFEGTVTNPVVLYKLRPGNLPGEPERMTGQRILYNRKTGAFHMEKGNLIEGLTR
jgi:hypothetical protein